MISKKHLLIIDSILIIGILASVFMLVGYSGSFQPLAIAPLPSESENLLFVLPTNDYILIDDNSRFDSPETVFIGQEVSMAQGKYFLKFFNGLSSEIRQIDTEVDIVLEIRKIDERSVGVFNTGNSALNIETYDKGSLIDSSLAHNGGKNE